MFTKNYEVIIESVHTMNLVRALGHYGLRFKVGDEYAAGHDPEHKWYRTFIIHANKRQMKAIMKAIGIVK